MKLKAHKLIIFIFLLVILSSCTRKDDKAYNLLVDAKYLPNMVQSIPYGFISLNAITNNFDGVLTSFFWSTNIAILDAEGVTVFQTDVKDDSFIVLYNNNFYVNEKRFLEISNYAIEKYQ